MTEMKEKIYPTLPNIKESPSAPAIELNEIVNDQGHSHRLKVITDAQKSLEEEISVNHLVKNSFVWLSM